MVAVEAPNDGQLYGRQSETWAVIPDGGTGAGMVISDTPPTDKVTGMQWLDSNGDVFIWDEDKWIEFLLVKMAKMALPVPGADGKFADATEQV